MAAYDLIVKESNIIGAALAPGDSPTRSDIAVGKIAAVAPDLDGTGDEEVGARGLCVSPDAIDTHARFNEPGRTGWEGFATGTQALVAGGATAYVEMPLEAYPPTLDANSFDLKLSAAKAASLVALALWGGLVRGPIERLDDLPYRCGTSPFVGRTFRANAVRTSVRGTTVYLDGEIVSRPLGRLVKPDKPAEPDNSRGPPIGP